MKFIRRFSTVFRGSMIGESKSMRRQFTEQDVIEFSKLSKDYNPIHLNESYAQTRFPNGRIVQGMLVATMFSSIFGTDYPGEGSIYVSQTLRFLHPGKKRIVCHHNRYLKDLTEVDDLTMNRHNRISIRETLDDVTL